MNFIRLEIPGLPASKGSLNRGRAGQLYAADKKLPAWTKTIWYLASRQAPEQPSERPIFLTLVFKLPAPQTRRELENTTKPDIDKLARAIMDALTGIIYKDDAQVYRLEATKVYADTPGAIIEIREAVPWPEATT